MVLLLALALPSLACRRTPPSVSPSGVDNDRRVPPPTAPPVDASTSTPAPSTLDAAIAAVPDAAPTDAPTDSPDALAPEPADPAVEAGITASFRTLGRSLTITRATPAAAVLFSGTIASQSHLAMAIEDDPVCRRAPGWEALNGYDSQRVTLDVRPGVDHVRVWLFSEDTAGLFVQRPDHSVDCEFTEAGRSAVVDLPTPSAGRYRIGVTAGVTETVVLLGVARDARARPWRGRMPSPPLVPGEVRAQWEVRGSEQTKELTLVLQGAVQRRIRVGEVVDGECRPRANRRGERLTMGCSPSGGDQDESPIALRPDGPNRYVIVYPGDREVRFEIPPGTRLVEHPQRRAVHVW